MSDVCRDPEKYGIPSEWCPSPQPDLVPYSTWAADAKPSFEQNPTLDTPDFILPKVDPPVFVSAYDPDPIDGIVFSWLVLCLILGVTLRFVMWIAGIGGKT